MTQLDGKSYDLKTNLQNLHFNMKLTSLVKFPLLIIDEYFLIIRFKIDRLLNSEPPLSWTKGDKGNFVIIQGLYEHFNFLKIIGDFINSQGYKVHILKDLNNNTLRIKDSVKIVESYAKENNLDEFNIICHSKGGIVAKYFLINSRFNDRIGKVISISSPYQGTLLSRLFDADLIPNSEVINLIKSDKRHNSKFYNLYPKIDNHVIPNKNLLLDGAINIKIDVVGHTRILTSSKTLEAISKII